jgi:ribonucleoside-triphosphate reductase
MNIKLYKSATCPQCKVAKTKLDQKGISYTEMYVENMDAALLENAGIKGIPTLIVEDEAKRMTIKLTTLRDISKWINTQEASNG